MNHLLRLLLLTSSSSSSGGGGDDGGSPEISIFYQSLRCHSIPYNDSFLLIIISIIIVIVIIKTKFLTEIKDGSSSADDDGECGDDGGDGTADNFVFASILSLSISAPL